MTTPPRRISVPLKPITESKTVWVGAITIILGVLGWFGVLAPEQASPERIEAIAGGVLVLVGAVNTVIRVFFTKAPTTYNLSIQRNPS